jgi:hypothetical protein
MCIGTPIPPEELFAGDLDGAYERVTGAVQELVDASKREQFPSNEGARPARAPDACVTR